jgi:predicted  nucleic acid-binding Zn ribbon protein
MNMFTSEYVFSPKKNSPKARERLVDAAYGLLASLAKNGQIYGEQIMTWISGKLYITCYVPRPDSLSTEYLSGWGRQDYDSILLMLTEAPSYRILDDSPFPKNYSGWQTAKTLYLFTTLVDISSPICSGNDGEAIPLYLVALTDHQKQSIFFWQGEYKAVDKLWIGSGELEMSAYRQLADPKSGLAIWGRKICQEIETATQKPTYYYLTRYWGRRTGEAERPCPGCGKSWATRSPHKRFFDFEFRCDTCRLVANQADVFDDERHARIGEASRALR